MSSITTPRRRSTRSTLIRHLAIPAAAIGTAVLASACVPTSGSTTPSVPTTTTTKPTTTAAPTPTTVASSGIPVPAGWKLHFSDEFNGTALNTNVWKPYHNTYGDGNKEIACLTPNNVRVANGSLRITSRRETVTCPNGSVRHFTSGFVGTRERGLYFPRHGRFEMRAKLPHGQGLWPAFWLRHRNGSAFGEVDIMEYFHSQVPGSTTGTLHWNYKRNVAKKTAWFETPTSTPGWHTWAVDILPSSGGTRFIWYIDGKEILNHVNPDRAPIDFAPGQGIWDIALNTAVGGTWNGHPDDPLGQLRLLGICSIHQFKNNYPNCPSTGIRRAAFPATYEIDYVRVYTK